MMKVIARLLGLVAMVLSPSYVVAQQVATIGIGELRTVHKIGPLSAHLIMY